MGTEKMKGSNYAWVIVVACIAFYAIPVGMIGNCSGIFAAPVMEEFGWSRTETTLYMSIQPLVAAIVTPFAGKILARFNARWVLTITAFCYGASSAACAWFTEPWQWDIYGVIYGACGGFYLFLAVPTIINRWFVKHSGLAIGIASTGIGVIAAFSNPMTQFLIDDGGWQMARFVMSAVCTIISVGLTALLLRPSPESMGVYPYGYEQADRADTTQDVVQAEGATVRQALRSPALYILMFIGGGFCFCATFLQQVSSYCAMGPLGAQAGAFAVSIAMIGSIVGKPLLGWMSDRIGAVPTGILAGSCGACGLLIALLSGSNLMVFYAGIAVFGIGYSALSIVSPMLGSQGFGTAHFSEIYSYVCTAISFASAIAAIVFALIYDHTGSFTADFVLVIAVYVAVAVLCPIMVKLAQRSWKQ